MDALFKDIRYGFRGLLKRPGFTATAVITLSLGIGANTAIFSVVNAVLLRVLPYKEPERLVQVFQSFRPRPQVNRMPVAPANFIDWQTDNKSFEAFAAYRLASFNLSGDNNPERVRAAQVTANTFAVLGVAPVLGRAFQAGEDSPAGRQLAMLNYGLWQRRFAGDRAIIGKTFRANNETYTVIGVMPQGFRFPIGWLLSEVEIWTPLALTEQEQRSREAISLDVIARLRPEAKREQAQSELDVLMRQLEQAYPQTNKDWGVNIMPLADRGVSDYRRMLMFLSLAVGVVLLLACANVANLLLARGLSRQKELTVRAALGARRRRLIRQLLTEGLMLSSLAGLGGILLALWSVRALTALAPASGLLDLKHVSLDGRVLAFSAALSLVTGILFSLLPSLTLTNLSFRDSLQESGNAVSESPRRNRVRAVLVVGELSLTLAMLLCAGTLIRSFLHYMAIDPGFVAKNTVTMRIALPAEKYKSEQQWAAFFARAEEEIKTIPGVSSAAFGSGAPMEGAGDTFRYRIAGKPAPDAAQMVLADYFRISPDYFRAAGIALRHGRYFNAGDAEGAPPVAIVNETFARREFPDLDPLGQRIVLLADVNKSVSDESGHQPLEIVGVVADTKDYGLYHQTPPLIFVPIGQSPQRAMSLLVKSAADPNGLLPEIRARLLKLDADQPVYNVRALEQIIRDDNALFRLNTMLLTVFAAVALALALVGTYGVMAYGVGQRTKEFGIRLALGARPLNILGLILRRGVALSAVGLGLGLAASIPALKLLARSLKESMNLDLIGGGMSLFILLGCAMALVALLACYIPARRATKVDPLEALRYE